MEKSDLGTKLEGCLFFVAGVAILFSLPFLVYSFKWEGLSILGFLGMFVVIILWLIGGCTIIWIGSFSFMRKEEKQPPPE